MPPSDRRIELGKRIKELRQAKGITGHRLAEKAKISPGFLSEIEHGSSDISSERLLQLAEALEVSIHTLLGTNSPSENAPSEIRIPKDLSEAAEALGLSYSVTLSLLQGKQSLLARRSTGEDQEWTKDRWIKFYKTVEPYLKQ